MLRYLIFSVIFIYFGVVGQERCRVEVTNEEVTSCEECLWTKGEKSIPVIDFFQVILDYESMSL